jgi:hypothetical protein
MISCENCEDGMHVIGVTSCRSSLIPDDNGLANGSSEMYTEHCHTFDLGGTGHSELSGVVESKEVESMDIKERIATLRGTAQTLATSNPAESKRLKELADAMEKEHVTEGVEEVIAARVKNGDLIPKNVHETALAAARTEGEAKFRKELDDGKKAEELKATTIASRMEVIKKAKLDPKFALGTNRTVETEVASIAIGPEGDKQFANRVEEWTTIQKATGQMTATEAGTDSGKRPPIATTNVTGGAAAGKKSALSFA